MIELKVTVNDENQAESLLQELNNRPGVTARVYHKPYDTGDECQSQSVSEPASSYGATANVDFSNDATHFFDGEKLYVTRRYYEDYIREMAYNFAHPEKQKSEPLRVVSNEELSNCISLEELDRHLTERIHRHFHPNE